MIDNSGADEFILQVPIGKHRAWQPRHQLLRRETAQWLLAERKPHTSQPTRAKGRCICDGWGETCPPEARSFRVRIRCRKRKLAQTRVNPGMVDRAVVGPTHRGPVAVCEHVFEQFDKQRKPLLGLLLAVHLGHAGVPMTKKKPRA